jgi:trans-aconitate methyltransferase
MKWDSDLNLRSELERTQPSIDLAPRIPLEAPQEIIDLGCGPGNSTQVLQRRWANAHITGPDSSPEMIKQARQRSAEIEWRIADINSYGTITLRPGRACQQYFPTPERLAIRAKTDWKPTIKMLAGG